jgi:F-type H+-transporting ATPase subunit b
MTAFAQILVLATEAGGEEDLQLLPAPAELIWGLVSFAILFFFMSRLAFPRINAMLDERTARIQGQIEEAESQRQEAERLRRQYEEQLAGARNQAGEIIEEARRDAERVRGDLVSRAEQEAEQIVSRARDDAEASRARVVADLRNQVALTSVELAGRIVQRELDPERHRELVNTYIDELSGLN